MENTQCYDECYSGSLQSRAVSQANSDVSKVVNIERWQLKHI